jgi:hypothetical protein
MDIVYQKTRKGEDEIKARSAKLIPKLRTMLILIDGSKTVDQLGGIAKQLGLPGDYIAQLEGQGLIARAGPAPAAGQAAPPQDEYQRFSAARRFMNDTVVNSLGIRAFFFTLKMEKCSTRAELAEMLDDYDKAIAKGASPEEAKVLTDRARELLR